MEKRNNSKNPKQKIEALIKTHGYKNIKVEYGKEQGRVWNTDGGCIPKIIYNFIQDNYNMRSWHSADEFSGEYIEFDEFMSIGLETDNVPFMTD